MGQERTIARLWQDAVARNREGAAYLVQHGDHWHDVGWAEAAERVENLANGLLARGVRKGESFAIFARTIVEWSLFDFALAQVGAVVTPIYPNSRPTTRPTSSTTRSPSGCCAETRSRRLRSRSSAARCHDSATC